MEHLRNLLGAVGCIFVGAGVGMAAEHYGCSSWLGGKLFLSTASLLIVWVF